MIGKQTLPPPVDPSSEDITFCSLRLLRSRRVGPATYHRLMREHGTAAAALDALPQIAAAAGVTDYKISPKGVVIADTKSRARQQSPAFNRGSSRVPCNPQ